MIRRLSACTLGWALMLATSAQAIAQQPSDGAATSPASPPSAFMPAAGQTARYQFSDTLTTPKKSTTEDGTMTVTRVAGNEVRVTIAIDDKAPRSFDFHLDSTGELLSASKRSTDLRASTKPRSKGQSTPGLDEQALILRLSIAAHIGSRAGDETSLPVLLDIPWASSPVNPVLSIKSTAPGAFAGDASDTTTINPPQTGQPHILRPVLISAGVGAAAGAIGGTAGRLVGPAFTVGSLRMATHNRPGPLPTDVKLHVSGQVADGRLRTLSGDQEYVVQVKKHPRTFSDKWSLVAQ